MAFCVKCGYNFFTNTFDFCPKCGMNNFSATTAQASTANAAFAFVHSTPNTQQQSPLNTWMSTSQHIEKKSLIHKYQIANSNRGGVLTHPGRSGHEAGGRGSYFGAESKAYVESTALPPVLNNQI